MTDVKQEETQTGLVAERIIENINRVIIGKNDAIRLASLL